MKKVYKRILYFFYFLYLDYKKASKIIKKATGFIYLRIGLDIIIALSLLTVRKVVDFLRFLWRIIYLTFSWGLNLVLRFFFIFKLLWHCIVLIHLQFLSIYNRIFMKMVSHRLFTRIEMAYLLWLEKGFRTVFMWFVYFLFVEACYYIYTVIGLDTPPILILGSTVIFLVIFLILCIRFEWLRIWNYTYDKRLSLVCPLFFGYLFLHMVDRVCVEIFDVVGFFDMIVIYLIEWYRKL